MGKVSRIHSALKKILLRPLFGSILTLMAIITGMVGSIFSAEIRNAFPFYWGKGIWSWEACLFWCLALCASCGYFFRESAQANEQQRLQRETLKQAKEFECLVRTLPPKGFLSAFGDLYGSAYGIQNLVQEDPCSPEMLQTGIRNILRIIAILTAKFDHDPHDVTYAANVMIFRRTDDIPVGEKAAVVSRLYFCDGYAGLEGVKGILDLRTDLSTTNNSQEAEVDPAMQSIALGVPIHPRTIENRYRVIPGAPLAFVEKRADLYADTSLLPEWCKTSGDFTQEMINKLSNHFRDSPVRGFVSIPLLHILDDGSDDEENDPIAILNVHCTRPGLLAQGEALAHLEDLIRPFRMMLVKLLLSLLSLELSAGQPIIVANKAN